MPVLLSLKTRQSTTNQQLVIQPSTKNEHSTGPPISTATADAKFGIMVDATVISSTSSFFFIRLPLISFFLKYGISTDAS
jgi:hypothetical protein